MLRSVVNQPQKEIYVLLDEFPSTAQRRRLLNLCWVPPARLYPHLHPGANQKLSLLQ